MERKGDEVHLETDEARGGESQGTMRWVLGVGLFLAIALLSIIWITGALTQDPVESEATVSGKIEAANESGGDGTDGIVSDNADDLETAVPQTDEAVGTIENETAE
ncbi:hypothetical protein [Altererythrobacter aquiaggeris]|uniref:hypothetical protein n=1 Tax=Aestuarierythrobacter aquiaggeris TaxID=1898396 RepID=UPI003018FF5D